MDNRTAGNPAATIALLKKLHQSRQFGPDPVPAAALEEILDVGRWTGSGMNRQPWEFVVIHDRTMLQTIAEAENGGSWLPGAVAAIVIVMNGAMPEIETYDEGRLTERLLLAAAAHGLGGGIWWYKDDGAAAKRLLGIPDEHRVRTAVGLGYPPASDDTRPKKPDARRPLSELVHQDRY